MSLDVYSTKHVPIPLIVTERPNRPHNAILIARPNSTGNDYFCPRSYEDEVRERDIKNFTPRENSRKGKAIFKGIAERTRDIFRIKKDPD